MKSSTYYFHIKTKILADFQIYIRVPLPPNSNQPISYSVLAGETQKVLPSVLRKSAPYKAHMRF